MSRTEPRPITMHDRAVIAAYAENLYDKKAITERSFDEMANAVRCCDEFPECSHILEWTTQDVDEPGAA